MNAQDQYQLFKKYSKKSPARSEKLENLTTVQFTDFSQDLYDELNRRNDKECMDPFLPINELFHAKRNQARQKLATLGEERFEDLIDDFCVEHEYRVLDQLEFEVSELAKEFSAKEFSAKESAHEDLVLQPAEDIAKTEPKPVQIPGRFQSLYQQDISQELLDFKTQYQIKEQAYQVINQETQDLKMGFALLQRNYREIKSENELLRNENKETNMQLKELKAMVLKQQKELSELARQHYRLFTDFLRVDLPQLRSQTGNSRSSAREKLTRLSKNQFSELSTDVYDELNRRLKDTSVPYLSVNEMYHPKRNQARQKLASLQVGRFKELVSDVFFEIERRFPQLLEPQPQYQYQQPYPPQQYQQYPSPQQQYQQPSQQPLPPIPDRKTSLEPLPVNFASLDSLMADLGGMMSAEKRELQPQASINNDTTNGDKVQQLLGQLEEMKGRYIDKEKEVKDLLEKQKKHLEFEQQYRKLDDEHERLKLELSALQEDAEEQQQITSAIRGEATNLLGEIKQLSLENQTLKNSNKQLGDDMVGLTKENSQLRETNQKNSQRIAELSQIVTIPNPEPRIRVEISKSSTVLQTDSSKERERENPNIDFQTEISEEGYFDRKRLEPYTLAVNQLLSEAQSKQANTNILVAMKQIVLACKSITEDCDKFEAEKRLSKQEKLLLTQIKSKLSSYLTNQMLVAKSAATEAPKEDFYANIETATSDLTAVVVELVKTINSYEERPASPSRPQSPIKLESPRSPITNGNSQSGAYDRSELKAFLEQQTDLIVQTIQKLLLILKQTTPLDGEFRNTIEGISKIVTTLIKESSATLRGATPDLQTQGEVVLSKLKAANKSLVDLCDQMAVSPGSKQTKQQIASSSYEIAKYVKQLISLME
ncbi:component of the polarisome [Terramyces sp. JEL0728]|nr:component of the polarisome [Terramyces sp. JEL0728]